MSGERRVNSPRIATSDGRPIAMWHVLLLGVLAALTWAAAVYCNVAPLASVPTALRGMARTPLALAVPALLVPGVFVALSWRQRPRAARTAAGLLATQVLVLLMLAVPALLPYSPTNLVVDWRGLLLAPLRVPTLSLGIAAAMVDPFIRERPDPYRIGVARGDERFGSAPGPAAGLAFGVSVMAIYIAIDSLATRCVFDRNDLEHPLTCLLSGTRIESGTLLWVALLAAVAGLLGSAIGYGIGGAIARRERWS